MPGVYKPSRDLPALAPPVDEIAPEAVLGIVDGWRYLDGEIGYPAFKMRCIRGSVYAPPVRVSLISGRRYFRGSEFTAWLRATPLARQRRPAVVAARLKPPKPKRRLLPTRPLSELDDREWLSIAGVGLVTGMSRMAVWARMRDGRDPGVRWRRIDGAWRAQAGDIRRHFGPKLTPSQAAKRSVLARARARSNEPAHVAP